ncbi:MAG TPA: hypothetical protein VIY47_03640 [Ignavibacteriaceae bacterium]
MTTNLAGDPFNYNAQLVAGNGITITSGASYQSLDITLTENKDFQDLMSRIAGIEHRLAILRPNWELQARFPALLEAYEHYKLIEKLVNDQAKTQILK